MGFMSDTKQTREKKVSTTYLEVDTDTTRLVRPLKKAPVSRWIHIINDVTETGPDGKPTVLRYFSTVPCISVNKSGQGCPFCTTKDPYWSKLPKNKQTTQKGDVTHFPKRQQFEIPVWDYELNDVRILRGKQVFGGMDAWWDARKSESEKDLTRLDWIVSKKGSGDRTVWMTQPDEVKPFVMTDEVKLKLQECELRAALESKMPTGDDLYKKIHGSAPKTVTVPTSSTNGDSTPPWSQPEPELPPVVEQKVASQSSPPVQQQTASASKPSGKKEHVAEFSKWIASTKEFQGPNLSKVLLPELQSKLGRVDFQNLSESEIADLKAHLEGVLARIRGS